MSPRAAWRLDALGFEQVFDYVPGKADWSATGLTLEGAAADEETAGGAADPSVPTCTLADELQQGARACARDRVASMHCCERRTDRAGTARTARA